jgi:hypothetical protein
MREQWTDERLDDMNERMSEGFYRLDDELRGLRSDLRAEFAAVRVEMNSRFEATQRLIVQIGAGMFGAMVIGFIGLVVSQH